MPGECVYLDKPRTVPLRPWHDAPKTPCGCGGVGCLNKYGGPETMFCPACGHRWDGSDAELEQAMISECWWDAFYNNGSQSEHDFAVSNGGC